MNSSSYSSGPPLKKGLFLLINQGSVESAGELLRASPNQLNVAFSELPSAPLETGKQVTIRCWDEEAILYWWKTEVISTSDHGRHVEVAILEQGMDRREHHRFTAPIPFSFTIRQADETSLIGQKGVSRMTNLSWGGLLCEMNLPLRAGDKLTLDLHLSLSDHLHADGWVVRSEKAERTEQLAETMDVEPANLIAIGFQRLDDEARLLLLKFLLPAEA